MVMMASANTTQFVAHAFVSQYYTMLHRDPSQLHRFYTNESRMTHGGSPNYNFEEAVYGQEAIAEKIRDLNFECLKCHTVIKSVDSHPTLGEGIVIQVNGVLSNGDQPSRKFMQTFVLQKLAANKYNVHNDIFRYQDDIFDDVEESEEANGACLESEPEDVEQEVPVNQLDDMERADTYIEDLVPPVESNLLNNNQYNKQFTESAFNVEQYEKSHYPANQFNESQYSNQYENFNTNLRDADVIPNGNVDPAIENLIRQPEPAYHLVSREEITSEESSEQEDGANGDTYPPSQPITDNGTEFLQYDPVEINVHEETVDTPVESAVVEAPVEQPSYPVEQVIEPEPEAVEEPGKPFTWASLAKKKPTNAPAAIRPVQKVTHTAPKVVPKVVTVSPKAPAPQRKQEDSRKRDAPVNDNQKRGRPFLDENQIFIGNLPHDTQEDDIKGLFSEHGAILEVRLNPKNFGFVVFDNAQAPLTILEKKREGEGFQLRNQTINIEPKQSTARNAPRKDQRRDGGGRPGNRDTRSFRDNSERDSGNGRGRQQNESQKSGGGQQSRNSENNRSEKRDNRSAPNNSNNTAAREQRGNAASWRQ